MDNTKILTGQHEWLGPCSPPLNGPKPDRHGSGGSFLVAILGLLC
jgi:hypothetical protein